MGTETVRDRSGRLAGAMEGRLTGAGHGKVIGELLVHSRELLDSVGDRTVKSAALHPLGGIVLLSSLSICDGDRCEGR